MMFRPGFHSLRTILFDNRPTLVTNSFFNTSQLKFRIQMLINPETDRWALWHYMLILPITLFLLMCSQKDAVDNSTPFTGEVYDVVDQNPEPRGGMAALGEFLAKNLRYPLEAQKANVQGKVFVRFVVATDGHIADVQILKGLGYGCDEESVRVIKLMPNWIPGRQNGKAVNVRFNLPIQYTLDERKTTSQTKKADFLAKYSQFTVNGKNVDKVTFRRAFASGFQTIHVYPTRGSMSITTPRHLIN